MVQAKAESAFYIAPANRKRMSRFFAPISYWIDFASVSGSKNDLKPEQKRKEIRTLKKHVFIDFLDIFVEKRV